MKDHAHCPYDCDHPQPFRATLKPELASDYPHVPPGEHEFCGRCWHHDGLLTIMVPCTPETCADAPGT